MGSTVTYYNEEYATAGLSELQRTVRAQNGKEYVFDEKGYCVTDSDSGLDLAGFTVVEGKPELPEIIVAARGSGYKDGPLVEVFADAEMIGQTVSCPDGHTVVAFREKGGKAYAYAPDTCGLDKAGYVFGAGVSAEGVAEADLPSVQPPPPAEPERIGSRYPVPPDLMDDGDDDLGPKAQEAPAESEKPQAEEKPKLVSPPRRVQQAASKAAEAAARKAAHGK